MTDQDMAANMTMVWHSRYNGSMTRQYGEGTIYLSTRSGRWNVQVSAGTGAQRQRISHTYATEDEAIRGLAAFKATGEWPDNGLRRVFTEKRVRQGSAFRRDIAVRLVLAEARKHGWDDEQLAKVLTLQLGITRLLANIFGPCVYCGTWEAGHIDHVIPMTRGGTDDPRNRVSCCKPCNHAKGDRTPQEWHRGDPKPSKRKRFIARLGEREGREERNRRIMTELLEDAEEDRALAEEGTVAGSPITD